MSTIEVNTIAPISGSNDVTLGGSSKNIKFASGTTVDFSTNTPTTTLSATMKNTPSFLASKTGGANQAIANDTETLITYPNEIYDTDNTFNTSNNRFTPTVAGKYYVYANMRINTATDFELCELRVQKNGGTFLEKTWRNEYFTGVYIGGAVDMNGSSDYVEVKIYQSSGSSQDVTGYSQITFFGAYKLIGA